MNSYKYLRIVYCVLLILTYQSCTNSDLYKDTKTLRIQVQNEPDILNPALSRLSVSTFIENTMNLPLATWDDDQGTWKPVLTQSFEGQLTTNGITYTLVLRPEARWSNGEPVSAADLVYTLKMAFNPYISQQSWAAYIDLITGIEVSDNTLFLSMDTPYILADEFIAGLTPYPAHVLDPDNKLKSISFLQMKSGELTEAEDKVLQELAQDFNAFGSPEAWPNPVSGLFQMVQWTPDQSLSLKHIEEFWGQHIPDIKSYYDTNIDTLQFVIIPDPQNAVNAFSSGSIDVLNSLDDKDSAVLASFSGKTYEVPTLQLYYVALNHRNLLLGKKIIRQAMSMAINRNDIVSRLFQGNGQPVNGPIHPDKSYYLPLDMSYNPESATSLLKKAGCIDRNLDGILECPVNDKFEEMTFHIWTTRSQVSRNVATLLKGYWGKIGIRLIIQSSDFRTFLPDLQNKNYDMATLAMRQNNVLDDPYPLWHSSQASFGGKNYQDLRNDSIDQVLEDLREAIVPSEQKQLYLMLQEMFAEEVPVFFLVAPDDLVGVRENIDLHWTSQRPGYDLLRSKITR